ncbi:copper resistance CopC/CopD family protein [Actinacidiphila bryophytorum]|uniref:Protein YobA n=1 Tax=Actinacidiphila bryophytorum TaxID=1436133 RepID=A0A9W4H4H2_9ACTN|nr:copper resistance protein CopC [Actinacidiphila bryophytorum]MBM9437208.1 copper resistance protein CopC/CopD [Actinacidiphila bryophytorum]MBN6544120.1 copper resistance protein CopC/CopD [Actinacidiphila bryophytorum]CAG7651080.1 Copper transport protein [Actinacidiphila bryophytorum]
MNRRRLYVPLHGPVRRLAAVLAACAALFAVAVATAAPASAHAALIRTDPASGSVVQTAPQQVVLTFSEGVLLSADSLRVLDPAGTNVATGAPSHAAGKDSGATATVALRGGIGNGTYTVAWKAVSQDSHPVAGAFTFSVGAPSKTTVDVSDQAAVGGGAAGTLYGVARYFAYGGFALLVGGCVFLSVCWPRGALLRPLQRLVAGGWAALVAATIALIMLRAPYVNGSGLGDAFDLSLIRAQLETRPGAALVSRLLLLAAAAVFLAVLFGSYAKREDPEERADLAWGLGIGGSVVAVGIAATWAMAEHASVGIQRKVAMPVDVVHLLSMAVWLGGLITLLTALFLPSGTGTVERAAVRRFSALALTAITSLVGTGIYQAWRQIGTWRAFTDTSYGRLLLIKIGLVCSLVCVAWFSRRWTRMLGEPGAAVTTGVPALLGKVTRQTARLAPRQTVRAAAGGPEATADVDVDVDVNVANADADGQEPSAGTDTGTRTAAAAAAGSDSGSGAGTRSSRAGGSRAGSSRAGGSGAGGSDDPRRKEQLRRQQDAAKAAREKKARNADPARSALRRSVLAEAGIAVVLLTVTTILSGSQPGRAAEEQKALGAAPAAGAAPGVTAPAQGASQDATLRIPFDTGGPGGKGTADLTLSPARAGSSATVHLELTAPGGLPLKAAEVRLAFTLPAQKLGPLQAKVSTFGAGHWIASGVQLPLAGAWQVAVTVRTSDIDEVTVTGSMQITS